MFDKIDHIGIAVNNLEEALLLYRDKFGLQLKDIELVEEQKVKIAFLPVGESKIELLEPTDPDSPIAIFLQKSGEGIHHLAFQVTGLEEKLKALQAIGVRLVDEKPRHGAGGALIAFLHPRSTGGLLIELCQHKQ